MNRLTKLDAMVFFRCHYCLGTNTFSLLCKHYRPTNYPSTIVHPFCWSDNVEQMDLIASLKNYEIARTCKSK